MQIEVELDYSDLAGALGPKISKVTIPQGDQEKSFHFLTLEVLHPRTRDLGGEWGGYSVQDALPITS